MRRNYDYFSLSVYSVHLLNIPRKEKSNKREDKYCH